MFAIQHFTTEQAREFGDKFGIDWDWSRSNEEQPPMEFDIEVEHGRNFPAAAVARKVRSSRLKLRPISSQIKNVPRH